MFYSNIKYIFHENDGRFHYLLFAAVIIGTLNNFVFYQQQILGQKFCASEMHLSPPVALAGSGSVVANLLFNVLPVVCGSSVFVFVLFCITLCRSILVLQSS